MIRTLTLLATTALLAGCAAMNSLTSDVASYSAWPADRKPGSYAFERLPSQQARPERLRPIPFHAQRTDRPSLPLVDHKRKFHRRAVASESLDQLDLCLEITLLLIETANRVGILLCQARSIDVLLSALEQSMRTREDLLLKLLLAQCGVAHDRDSRHLDLRPRVDCHRDFTSASRRGDSKNTHVRRSVANPASQCT